jgi:pimeloyl-ACP methyl ester carboxylesterase
MSLLYTVPSLENYITEECRQALASQTVVRLPRADAIEAFVDMIRMAGASPHLFDERRTRALGMSSYDRCYCPEGAVRQAAAVRRLGNLVEGLKKLQLSAAVIHGRDDRVLKYEGGVAIGEALRNADVHIYSGMGHEFAEPLWDEFSAIIVRTVQRSERMPGGAVLSGRG